MQHLDIAMIGPGSGNFAIDERFSHLGVVLIEDDPVFGDTCLNRDYIPTRMFAVVPENARTSRHATRPGMDLEFRGADWPVIRGHVFGHTDPISRVGCEWRRKGNRMTLSEGHAGLIGTHILLIGDVQINADQIVTVTGSRPRSLPMRVPEELRSQFYTSNNVMRMDELLRRLTVFGGGLVACELIQIFAGPGSQVTQIDRSEVMLRGEGREISEEFKREHARLVNLIFNQSIAEVATGPEGEVLVITTDRNGAEYEYLADAILVTAGHIRNSDSLNLAATGVKVGLGGQARVDKHQRTSQPHIWALGDVSSDRLLKHVTDAEARTVAANLLIDGGELVATDHRHIPHAVSIEPQIAVVGVAEEQLQGWGTPYIEFKQRYADVVFGWTLEDEEYFVKLPADSRTWHLLSTHIIDPQAATLTQPVIQAMGFDQAVQELTRGQYWIHPALTEALEDAPLGPLKAPRSKELDA